MSLKRNIQQWIVKWLHEPIIPADTTTGFSLVRSERNGTVIGKNAYAIAPYYLHNVHLGDYSYFAKNAQVANTTIGKFCSIGPKSELLQWLGYSSNRGHQLTSIFL